MTDMTQPPIGIYKNFTACPSRCEVYTYTLVDLPVSEADETVKDADFYLYLGSPNLEVWTEYRLVHFLDFVVGLGGAIGLILGMSVLSILLILLEGFGKIAKVAVVHRKSRSDG